MHLQKGMTSYFIVDLLRESLVFLQSGLPLKDEIIKTLLETHTVALQTVSKNHATHNA